jgi:predicted dehydrogenase
MEWSFRLNRAAKSAKWKLDPALNGLTCLTDAGIHCLDIALALFGRGKLKTVIPEEDRTDRTIEEVVLISSHGKVSVSTTCSRRYGPYSNSLRVAGTDGEIVVPEFFGESPAIKGIIYLNKTRKTIRANANNPYQLEVEDFAAILSGDDGLGVAATLDEALEVALVVDDVASQIASIRPER